MSLQGTLDTFALPDVLRLLASTAKTGHLRLDGSRGSSGAWLTGGALAALALPRPDGPAAPVAPTAEALFELLRVTGGAFSFEPDAPCPLDDVATAPVDELVVEAEALVQEWRVVEAVVPSLSCSVTLRPDLAGTDITVSAERWRLVVAVAAGTTVGALGEALALGELSVSRVVKELVEAGIAAVGEPVEAAAAVVETDEHAPSASPEVAQTPVADAPEHALRAASEAQDAEDAPHVVDDLRIDPEDRPQDGADTRPAAEEADRDDHGDTAAAAAPAPPRPAAPVDGFVRRPLGATLGMPRTGGQNRLSSALGDLAAASGRPQPAQRRAEPAGGDDDTAAIARRLAELGPDAAAKVAAAAAAPTAEERDAALDAIEADANGQPVNRSALLKFLSSVRT